MSVYETSNKQDLIVTIIADMFKVA